MALLTLTRSDSELINRSVSGDAKAFRELVNRYSSLVYNYIYRMTQNVELTNDMTQEVFLKAHKHLRTFDANRPFKPWILRVASNTTLSELRRKSGNVVSLDALQEDAPGKEWGGETPESKNPANEAETREMSKMVLQVLDQLEPNYRQALLLRYTEELSYEEISQAMEVPLNTVRTWIKRGRDKLKTLVLQKVIE